MGIPFHLSKSRSFLESASLTIHHFRIMVTRLVVKSFVRPYLNAYMLPWDTHGQLSLLGVSSLIFLGPKTFMLHGFGDIYYIHIYIYIHIYLQPVCPLFWGFNPPKQGRFKLKYGSFWFQVVVDSKSHVDMHTVTHQLNICKCTVSNVPKNIQQTAFLLFFCFCLVGTTSLCAK